MISILVTSSLHCTGGPSQGNHERKRNKNMQIGKEVKLPLFTGDIILYIGKAKESTKKLLELIYQFSKIAGYKINIKNQL